MPILNVSLLQGAEDSPIKAANADTQKILATVEPWPLPSAALPTIVVASVEALKLCAGSYKQLLADIRKHTEINPCLSSYALHLPGFRHSEVIIITDLIEGRKIPVLKKGTIYLRVAKWITITKETVVLVRDTPSFF